MTITEIILLIQSFALIFAVVWLAGLLKQSKAREAYLDSEIYRHLKDKKVIKESQFKLGYAQAEKELLPKMWTQFSFTYNEDGYPTAYINGRKVVENSIPQREGGISFWYLNGHIIKACTMPTGVDDNFIMNYYGKDVLKLNTLLNADNSRGY